MLLAEYGYTYDDITKWGGAHTAVSANDRVGMFQDGTLNAYLTLGPGQQSHIQELVLNAKVKWLPVSEKVLKSVTAKTGQSIGVIPGDFYGGAFTPVQRGLIETVHNENADQSITGASAGPRPTIGLCAQRDRERYLPEHARCAQ